MLCLKCSGTAIYGQEIDMLMEKNKANCVGGEAFLNYTISRLYNFTSLFVTSGKFEL